MKALKQLSTRWRHPLILFSAGATILLVGMLIWLAWYTLKQDQALFDRQVQDALDTTAARVTSALQDKFEEVGSRLEELAALPDSEIADAVSQSGNDNGNEVLFVLLEPGKLKAFPPVNLRYYPALSEPSETKSEVFETGESYEFQQHNFGKAATIYKELSLSTEGYTRAGALVRLARVLRKANDPHAALSVYLELAESDLGMVEGLPAELLARYARCVIFNQIKLLPELRKEAAIIWSGLTSAKWPLTPSAYRFYEKETLAWLGSDSANPNENLVLSLAVEELWRLWLRVQDGAASSMGERSLWVGDAPVFLMWRGSQDRIVALLTRSAHLEREWLEPVVGAIVESRGARLALADSEGNQVLGDWAKSDELQALVSALHARLPWTLQLVYEGSNTSSGQMRDRRRFIWGGLVIMISVILVAGYAIIRSIDRELAVTRLQRDFVAAVSHEFRTPLASLCHISELLQEGRVPSKRRRQQYYRALQRESERLQRLVEGVLDFRRMEGDAREYHLEWLDTTDLILAVGKEFAAEARDLGYNVEMEIEPSLPKLQGDRQAIGRVLWNLLENAVKYSPDAETVWLQARRVEDHLVVQVRDRGLGIAEEDLALVFDKFYRTEGAKASGVPGTGLGLAMVRHIVEGHHGQLEVKSRLGRGSTFTIHLPFERY